MSLTLLPIAAALAVVTTVSAVSALAFTFGLRRAFRPQVSEELKHLSTATATRLGALVALILALAFTNVQQEYNELSESIDEEAVLITQVLEDLAEEVGETDGLKAIRELMTYVRAIIHEDWYAQDPLAQELTSDEALVRLRRELDIIATTHPEAVPEIDQLVDEIERRRLQRLFDYDQTLPFLFWVLVILLSFVSLLPLIHYPPTRTSALYIGGYGTAIGIVLYGILMFSSPFESSTPIADTSFRVALRAIEQECEVMRSCTLQVDSVPE